MRRKCKPVSNLNLAWPCTLSVQFVCPEWQPRLAWEDRRQKHKLSKIHSIAYCHRNSEPRLRFLARGIPHASIKFRHKQTNHQYKTFRKWITVISSVRICNKGYNSKESRLLSFLKSFLAHKNTLRKFTKPTLHYESHLNTHMTPDSTQISQKHKPLFLAQSTKPNQC